MRPVLLRQGEPGTPQYSGADLSYLEKSPGPVGNPLRLIRSHSVDKDIS